MFGVIAAAPKHSRNDIRERSRPRNGRFGTAPDNSLGDRARAPFLTKNINDIRNLRLFEAEVALALLIGLHFRSQQGCELVSC